MQDLDLDGTALPFATGFQTNRYLMTSSELQWLGKAGPFDWVAGLYRFNDTGHTLSPQCYFFGAACFDLSYGFATHSKALYGQVNYHIGDRWTLTAGVRRTKDDRWGYETDFGPAVSIPGFEGKTSDSATTPMASVSYKFNDKVMGYVRYAEGFKGGGFNGQATSIEAASTPYGPEFKKSYEAGLKSTLLGGKLRVNGDVFYERNSGLQQTVAFSGANKSTGTNIINVGNSHDYGLELEAAALITPDFTVSANYAYIREKFDQYVVLGQNIADDQTVAGVLRNTFSLVANAVLARTSVGVVRGLLDYRFVDSFYPGVEPLEAPGTPPWQSSRTPAGGIINATLSLGQMNWEHGVTGEVAAWVRNLGNADHIDGKIDFGPPFGNLILGYYNQPRTFGLSVIATW